MSIFNHFNSFKIKCILIFVLGVISKLSITQILHHGHAHNDYLHSKPLLLSLENGFRSIEIDVYAFDSMLVVSHLPLALKHKKTISQLYFEPLKTLILNNQIPYTHPSDSIILMIDFKSNAEESLNMLLNETKKFPELFGNNPKIKIHLLISGNKPSVHSISHAPNFVSIDIHPNQLKNETILPYSSRISLSWSSVFKWRGIGKMPDKQLRKLREIVDNVHNHRKKLRFWAIPDKPTVWGLLLREGVDWINTDLLFKYAIFEKAKAPN